MLVDVMIEGAYFAPRPSSNLGIAVGCVSRIIIAKISYVGCVLRITIVKTTKIYEYILKIST